MGGHDLGGNLGVGVGSGRIRTESRGHGRGPRVSGREVGISGEVGRGRGSVGYHIKSCYWSVHMVESVCFGGLIAAAL